MIWQDTHDCDDHNDDFDDDYDDKMMMILKIEASNLVCLVSDLARDEKRSWPQPECQLVSSSGSSTSTLPPSSS